MKILSLQQLNTGTSEKTSEFVEESEARYRGEIKAAEEYILSRDSTMPIILISGPSGSAKTTTALRLASLLEKEGVGVHTVSMDNYFRPIDDPENEVDEDGRIDLESPKRLDMKLLNQHLEMLWNCKEIEIPTFDFSTQTRKPGKKLSRKKGELVIMEGIHALNPEITGNIGDHAVTIYVSVRTRLENGEGELLHPSKIRLMRRIVRDGLFRGRDIANTLDFFKWVERGEQRFIMPYKGKAMFDIDTFIGYEAAAYRDYVLPRLEGVRDSYPEYDRYADLEKFLREISPIRQEAIPSDSLVREFIGGSHYSY